MAPSERKFLENYFSRKSEVITALDFDCILDFFHALQNVMMNSGRVFVAGNGGSAATAEHFVTDIGIGSHIRMENKALRAVSLSSNIPLITAISNDVSYESIFAKQLELQNPTDTDLVVVISASGNSNNIVILLEKAKLLGVPCCAITGFDGGEARKRADISIHVPTELNEYGIVEDIHMSICHVITELLRR